MQRIGFVGLGAMGEPMAWNVHEADFELDVHNRTPERMEPFAEAGVDTAETPAAVAADADAVVVMVTGPDALRSVLTGPDGVVEGIEADTVVVNTSTVSGEATDEAAAAVREAGGRFVDAPVLGTVGPAERGELLVLAGADDDTLGDVRSLLETVGEVVHVGAVGDGTSTKLTTNLMLGVMMEGFSEALSFADGQGLDLETVLDVIDRGVVSSPLYSIKGEAVRERDFAPQFPVDLLFKDLNLVLDAAGEDETPLPATGATREAASATRALGHGDEDMIALLRHLEAMTGRTVGEE